MSRKTGTTSVTRAILLTVAAVISVVAIWATTDRWANGAAAGPLRNSALFLWILFAVSYYADRHLTLVKELRDEVAAYGKTRYSEGALDAVTRDHQPQAGTLHSIR